MRLRYLQALRAVMETGTVTEAAARLHRTQPQVSRLIANLEDELGFKLFLRDRRRLVPTAEGTAFYREAERILSGFDQISNIVRDIRTRQQPPLRLLAQPYIAEALLPDAIAAFTRAEPDFRFTLEIRSRGDVERWVAGQQFDLGIAALPVNVGSIRGHPFAIASVVAVVPHGHHLARKRTLEARDIAAHPFIALRPFTLLRNEIDRLFTELGLHLDIRGETSSGVSACQMVGRGLGITLADPMAARSVRQDSVVIRPWRPSLSLTYGFLYPAGHEPSVLALRFAETVRQTAKSLDPLHVELTKAAPGSN